MKMKYYSRLRYHRYITPSRSWSLPDLLSYHLRLWAYLRFDSTSHNWWCLNDLLTMKRSTLEKKRVELDNLTAATFFTEADRFYYLRFSFVKYFDVEITSTRCNQISISRANINPIGKFYYRSKGSKLREKKAHLKVLRIDMFREERLK